MKIALEKIDTEILKGIAILLLLFHHLFSGGEGFWDFTLHGHSVIKNLGVFSKLCVALFVFLSGYGLTAKAIKSGGIGCLAKFYRQRFVKLMINYWLIWFIFVPIGIFFFDRSFVSVYGENYLLPAFSDFIGIHMAVTGSPYGYNATWWFYSCIIALYLLYPIIWKNCRLWYLIIPFAFIFPAIVSYIPFLGNSYCGNYFLAFTIGISLAYLKPEINIKGLLPILIILFILSFFCLSRFNSEKTEWWDAAIITYGVVLYQVISFPTFIKRILSFFGNHSYNIFLFHTFIYDYYFHNFVYYTRNPLIIYITLLVTCILVSMTIQKIKIILRINELEKFLSN